MPEFNKYPSINQYRVLTFCKSMDRKIEFTGTVKVHGTNAGVLITTDGTVQAQGRKRMLSITEDNYGFAAFVKANEYYMRNIRSTFVESSLITVDQTLVIYGEWAGKGIQASVGVTQLDKFFYIFGAKCVETGEYLDLTKLLIMQSPIMPLSGIVFAQQIFATKMVIDLDNLASTQNELICLTNKVEEECPVAKYFGVTGIGEGIVWQALNVDGKRLVFKVKGEKHTISKVKTLADIDPVFLASITAFVDYSVTTNRLDQMFSESCNNIADRKLIGKFIRAMSTDIIKEEPDVLVNSGLCYRDVAKPIGAAVRKYLLDKEVTIDE